MNARADIDLVLPCYNPPSDWEERVATHFHEVERLFSPVRFHLFIVSDGSRRGYEPETIDRLRQLIPNPFPAYSKALPPRFRFRNL